MSSPVNDTPLSAPGVPLADGRRVGVLLSHGFTGTPASMRPWGEFLNAQGYAVEVPLLAGHGTTWEDLATKTWADWYADIEAAYDRLAAGVDEVVVAGLSMGGGLVLQLAAAHTDKIVGVIPVNPAVRLARLDVKVVPVAKYFMKSIKKIGGDIKLAGVSENAYDYTPLRALEAMVRGTKTVRAALPRVTQPTLLITSVTDHVVDPASRRYILEHIGSRSLTELRLHESYHVATIDNDQQLIFDSSLEFIRRVTGGPASNDRSAPEAPVAS